MFITTNKQLPLISAEAIQQHCTDEELFSYYAPADYIIGKGTTISNLRSEGNPSLGVFYVDKYNLWMFKDLGKGISGDIFQYVKLLFNYKTKFEACARIGYDFNLDKQYTIPFKKEDIINNNFTPLSKNKLKYKVDNVCHYFKKEIIPVKREWQLHDKQYWYDRYLITEETLIKFKVFPVSHIKIVYDNKVSYVKADKYAYVYEEFKDDKFSYKLYQPFSKIRKWDNNIVPGAHFGYRQLPKTGDCLIITKSGKDVMCLHDVMNLNAIAIQGETYMIKNTVMDEYKARFKKVYIYFDNDDAGKKATIRYMERYKGLTPIQFDSTLPKDFSDMVYLLKSNTASQHLKQKLQ